MKADRSSTAGSRYLDLQLKARTTGRPTDELIQLYALECFLDRLTRSAFAKNFVLKGGVLLAALNARRPTRDIDFAASAIKATETEVLAAVRTIARVSLDDGLEFKADQATAEIIREDDDYNGVRITLSGTLSRAEIHLHVDVNVGDPIWPEPQEVSLPRLLDGVLLSRNRTIAVVGVAQKTTTGEQGTYRILFGFGTHRVVCRSHHQQTGKRSRDVGSNTAPVARIAFALPPKLVAPASGTNGVFRGYRGTPAPNKSTTY